MYIYLQKFPKYPPKEPDISVNEPYISAKSPIYPQLITSATASDASHACCCLQGGYSALMRASMKGVPEVVAKLIAVGAKLDLQDKVSKISVPCGQCWRLICVCVVVY